MYVHTRNVYYANHGIDVTVLNFSAVESYEYENIRVITLADYESSSEQYDILVAHAPNLRNHYRFLKITDTYSRPYPYVKKSSWLRNVVEGL